MSGEKTVDNITFRIRHTMMLVSDLDRSIDFYTRLLGLDSSAYGLTQRNTSVSVTSATALRMNIRG
jgi:predicted enzyme related to lactoylglutathione lyase